MEFVLFIGLIFNVSRKGEDNVNAAGLNVSLMGMAGVLGIAFFQDLVTNGSISQGELDSTRKGISAAIEALKKTPSEKIEALVAEYDEDLTTYSDKFHARTGETALDAFRSAQMMAGYVTTIMAKSGIRE